MRLLQIQKKYEKLRNGVVAEHRRIFTPYFYFRLKTKTYKYKEWKSNFMPWPLLIELPKGQFITFKGWYLVANDSLYEKKADADLAKRLAFANEKTDNNVLKISA